MNEQEPDTEREPGQRAPEREVAPVHYVDDEPMRAGRRVREDAHERW